LAKSIHWSNNWIESVEHNVEIYMRDSGLVAVATQTLIAVAN
jgi:hypothetical protein